MRSRIFFVIACWSVLGLAWLSSSTVCAQTPLRPSTTDDVVVPAVQETTLRPEGKPVVPSEEVTSQTVQPAVVQPAAQPAVAKPETAQAQAIDVVPAASETAKKQDPAPTKGDSVRLGSAQLLPGHTKAWVSIPSIVRLQESFDTTQFGLLAKDKAIEPFIESLKSQFSDWAAEKNVRLGVKIENLDEIYSGEICLAGIVPSIAGQEIERGSHGLVLLVDVSGREDKATNVLAEVNRRLVEKGAVQTKVDINGASVTLSTVEKGKRLRSSQTTLQTIYDLSLIHI